MLINYPALEEYRLFTSAVMDQARTGGLLCCRQFYEHIDRPTGLSFCRDKMERTDRPVVPQREEQSGCNKINNMSSSKEVPSMEDASTSCSRASGSSSSR